MRPSSSKVEMPFQYDVGTYRLQQQQDDSRARRLKSLKTARAARTLPPLEPTTPLEVLPYSSNLPNAVCPPYPDYKSLSLYNGEKLPIPNLNRQARYLAVYCSRNGVKWGVTAGALDLSKAPSADQIQDLVQHLEVRSEIRTTVVCPIPTRPSD